MKGFECLAQAIQTQAIQTQALTNTQTLFNIANYNITPLNTHDLIVRHTISALLLQLVVNTY